MDYSPRVNQSFDALKSALIGAIAQLLASVKSLDDESSQLGAFYFDFSQRIEDSGQRATCL
jgi:hypothetical protein